MMIWLWWKKIAQWQRLKALVLDGVSSPITRRVNSMALDQFDGARTFREASKASLYNLSSTSWTFKLVVECDERARTVNDILPLDLSGPCLELRQIKNGSAW